MQPDAGARRGLSPDAPHGIEDVRSQRQRDNEDTAEVRRQIQPHNRLEPVAQSDGEIAGRDSRLEVARAAGHIAQHVHFVAEQRLQDSAVEDVERQ